MMRFNHNCTTHQEIKQYYINCARKFAHDSFKLLKIEEIKEGAWATIEYKGMVYYSLYLLVQYRGQGLYKKIYLERFPEKQEKIITSRDCNLSDFLLQNQIEFVTCVGLTQTPEYLLIEKIYNDRKTERSGVYLMNHIDEGLYFLYLLNARRKAKLAYILHPILQSDEEIVNNITLNEINYLDPKALILATEYRHIANDYLSFMDKSVKDIKLSPLDSVNQMLIADKIQNFKDFDKYNRTINNAVRLDSYFMNWFERLNIDESMFKKYTEYINFLDNL